MKHIFSKVGQLVLLLTIVGSISATILYARVIPTKNLTIVCGSYGGVNVEYVNNRGCTTTFYVQGPDSKVFNCLEDSPFTITVDAGAGYEPSVIFNGLTFVTYEIKGEMDNDLSFTFVFNKMKQEGEEGEDDGDGDDDDCD